MDAKLEPLSEQNAIVYIRPISVADLPAEMRAKVPDQEEIFAVHNAQGERLALVANRALAFALARQNDMTPVTVH